MRPTPCPPKWPSLLAVLWLSGVSSAEDQTEETPLQLALRALRGQGKGEEILRELRQLRNSRRVLEDTETLYGITGAVEDAMRAAYEGPNASRPGNFHGVKGHAYYVAAISEAHPALPPQAVQSIVASEWYHPALTAKAVWCTSNCGAAGFPLARRLDANYDAIRSEVAAFWRDPAAAAELRAVGAHTTQFDQLIAGNGSWADVRLWRGRGFHRRLCERHFRVLCALVETSPEVWTNPWGHVLLSVLLRGSWVPFHQGHSNGQLTYHLPLSLPRKGAELAVVEKGGTLPDDRATRGAVLSHPEERVFNWSPGQTLVFDDSFTHAVRFRADEQTEEEAEPEARVVLLMRGWHPELTAEEREALRSFMRKGGEEEPDGYELLPLGRSAFGF